MKNPEKKKCEIFDSQEVFANSQSLAWILRFAQNDNLYSNAKRANLCDGWKSKVPTGTLDSSVVHNANPPSSSNNANQPSNATKEFEKKLAEIDKFFEKVKSDPLIDWRASLEIKGVNLPGRLISLGFAIRNGKRKTRLQTIYTTANFKKNLILLSFPAGSSLTMKLNFLKPTFTSYKIADMDKPSTLVRQLLGKKFHFAQGVVKFERFSIYRVDEKTKLPKDRIDIYKKATKTLKVKIVRDR